MYKVVKEVKWDAAHRLLNYDGLCSHIHGHSFRALFTYECSILNKDGMAIDFNTIKNKIQKWVDEYWDHAFMLNSKDPLVKILSKYEDRIWIMQGNPTAENMANFLFMKFKYTFLEVNLRSVEVFEGPKSSAIYEEG